MAGLSRTVARNSLFGVAAQVSLKVLSFGFTIVVLRHLGAESYGQYAAVLAFGTLFVFFADLGLSPYVVRQVARWREGNGKDRVNSLYGSVLRLRGILGVLASIAAVGAAIATGRPPAMVIAIAMSAIGLLLYSVQGAADAVLAGLERIDISSKAKVINQAVFVAAGAALLWLGFGYQGLIVANILGVALVTFYCWRAVSGLDIRPRFGSAREWPALLRASIPFGVIGFALGLSYKFDSVLLSVTRSDVETGYYNAAYNLVFSAAIVANAFNTALYPSLARQVADGAGDLKAVCERALRYLMLLALPIAAGTAAVAPRLVAFLFTDEYLPAVGALQIVIWTVPLMFASEFLGYLALILGLELRCARVVLISTAFNIALNLALVPRLGFLAASAITVVTEAILVGQYLWLLSPTLRGLSWNRVVARPAVAASFMGILVFLLRDLPLGVDIAIGAVAYSVFAVAGGLVGLDELRFFRTVVRRGPRLAVATGGVDALL